MVPVLGTEVVTMGIPNLPFYIGGAFVEPEDSSQSIIDPANAQTLARAGRATAAEVNAAIAAARHTFDSGAWSGATAQRHPCCSDARRIRDHAADWPDRDATWASRSPNRVRRRRSATCFETTAGSRPNHRRRNPVPDDALSLTLKRPVGVCVDRTWNYPLLMAAWKIAPALCAGLRSS
jgi:acyl-CoA reductase-like NAD-dependent aldehyde dehydrogenase